VLLRKGELDALEALIGSELGDELAALDILLTGAALRVRQAKHEEAIKLAERVLARSSESWEAHLVKGQALLLSGDAEAGLMEIEQAKPKEPSAEVEMWMGQAFEYNGKPKDAVARYKAALVIDPNLDEAAALYGRQLAYAGSAKEALTALQPVVERTDAFPFAWVAIGIARKDLGKVAEAIAAFEKAVELDPKQFEAMYWKGRLHHDRNEHAKAEDALAAAIEIAADGTPYLDDAYRRLGNSRWDLGKMDAARTAYEKYLELAPPNAAGRAEVARRIK
jgi:superkiller protein 3